MLSREMLIIAEKMKELVDLVPVIGTLEKQIEDNPRSFETIANTVWLIRKSKEIMETIEKKMNQVEKKAAESACVIFPHLEEKKYSTDYCTISDNSTFYVKFPSSPRDEGFDKFVQQLPLGALRPHYPTVSDLITKKLEEGDQVPFGLSEFGIVGVEYKLRVTSKKEL